MKNYADRGLRMLSAVMDNILRDMHNLKNVIKPNSTIVLLFIPNIPVSS